MAHPEQPARPRRTGPIITAGVILTLLISLFYATCRTWAQSPPELSEAAVKEAESGT